MPRLLATTCQKREYIWWDSFVVMTSNLNLNVRPILQIFVALCAVSQPLNRIITKMVCVLIMFEVLKTNNETDNEHHSHNSAAIRLANEGTLSHSTIFVSILGACFFWDTQQCVLYNNSTTHILPKMDWNILAI